MKYLGLIFLSSIFILISCENKEKQGEISAAQSKQDTLEIHSTSQTDKLDSVAENPKMLNELIDIQSVNPAILVELKYATSDNFMNMRLYDHLHKAYLQKDVALKLSACENYLEEIRPGYHLLVYDAVRPVSVQWKMWNALDSIPESQRGKFVSNPANKSVHNFGAAVDLTIVDESGKPLDMGAGYDDIREIAYPSKETYYFEKGELSKDQIENRKLLRKVMKSQGFRNIPTEWWHFNACSRNEAKQKYSVLEEEPSF